jgi:hypothetical protein
MTTFQLVTLPALALIALFTAVAVARRKLAPRPGTTWLVLWLATAAAVADPEVLVHVAHFLGIGRGADLVLYLSILLNFFALFVIYLRFRRVDEQLTKIVRHLAIREAGETQPTSPESLPSHRS